MFLANSLSIKTLVALLRDRAISQPNQLAYSFLVDGETEEASLTYQELEQKARLIASLLQSLNATGERALLLYPQGLEFIAAFFGCLYAGVIAVPVYPPRRNQRLTRLQAIAQDAQAKFALTTTPVLTNIESSFKEEPELAALHFIATDNIASNLTLHWVDPNINSDTLAFLQYTSGSTGTPKGVMVSHGNLLQNSADLDKGWVHTKDSIIVTWLPTFHDMGLIYGVIQPLYKGLPCYMLSPVSFLQQPIRWLQAISRYRGTHTGAPNFAYDLCVHKITPEQRATLDLSSWQMALNGAEPVRADVLKRFAETFKPCGFEPTAFCPGYGLAEATLKVAAVRRTDAPVLYTVQAGAIEQNRILEATEDQQNVRTLVGCGRSEIDTKIVIVHPESLTQCSPEEVGEIWVSGSTVAQGYWMRPEETERTFRAYLTDTGDGPFLRTGDLGFCKDGELFVTGRLKDVVIIRGRNYYPQDIELTVEQSHSALKAGASVAFSVEVEGEERLIVAQEVERTYLRKLDADEVVGAIRQAVWEQHELPVYAVVLLKPASIPKTSSGKIQRHACKAEFLDGSLARIGTWTLASNIHAFSIPSPKNQEQLENGSSPVTTTVAARRDVSKQRADHLLNWLRGYAKERINSRLIDERRCVPPYIVMDFGNQGIMGMQIPEQYGGLALNHRDFSRVIEQLSAIDLTLASMVVLNNTIGIRPIMDHATQVMKDELLPLLAKGRELSSFGLTEPNPSGALSAISTIAVPDGNGGWRIRGVKRWNASAWAGMINVFVRLVDSNSKSQGLTGFVVRLGTSGLRIGPESLTMGLRGIMQNAIYFDDVPVESVHLLGELGNGTKPAEEALFHGRLGIGSICVGGMKRCAQLMLRYASRRAVATGSLLDNPITLSIFSHLTGAITALETLLSQIAGMLDEGQTLPSEVSVAAKIFGSDYLWQTADNLVQILGGRGYMENNIAPQILRDARILRVGEGSNESLKVFLGKSIIHTEHLHQFLNDRLGARAIANRLKDAAEQIQARCLKSDTVFVDHSAAIVWAYSLIGEVAIYALLLATVQNAQTFAPSAPMQRAVQWSQINFEQSLERAVKGTLGESILADGKTVTQLISSYTDAIDDIEQTLAGEDKELDILLRLHPEKTNAGLSSIDQNISPQSEPPHIETSDQAEQPSPPISSASPHSAQAIQDWIMNWLIKKFKIPATSIAPSQSFANFGLDSVFAVELTQDIEDWLGIALETTLMWYFPTIESLADHLANQFSNPASTSQDLSERLNVDLNAEVVLDSTIRLTTSNVERVTEPDAILLTGATGFVGPFLLNELLQQTQAKIYCLVRADNVELGKQKIQENLKRYLLGDGDYNSRIVPVIGDLSKPLLGLPEKEFQKMARQIDVIYHNGAWVNFIYPYEKLKATNVLGTQEVLRLASQEKVKPVHHISTYSIFCSRHYLNNEVIREQEDLRDGNGIYVGYPQSKWVAEKLIEIARNRGIPVSIYRLGDLAGDSQTGAFNLSNFTARIITSCIRLGNIPDEDMRVDITPVDYAVRATVHLSRRQESMDKVFHIVNPQSMKWKKLFNLIELLGYPRQQMSYTQWHLQLLEQIKQSSAHPLYPFLPLFSEPTSEERKSIFREYLNMPILDCQNTLDGLADTSIQCPPVDEKLLDTYFSSFIRSGLI